MSADNNGFQPDRTETMARIVDGVVARNGWQLVEVNPDTSALDIADSEGISAAWKISDKLRRRMVIRCDHLDDLNPEAFAYVVDRAVSFLNEFAAVRCDVFDVRSSGGDGHIDGPHGFTVTGPVAAAAFDSQRYVRIGYVAHDSMAGAGSQQVRNLVRSGQWADGGEQTAAMLVDGCLWSLAADQLRALSPTDAQRHEEFMARMFGASSLDQLYSSSAMKQEVSFYVSQLAAVHRDQLAPQLFVAGRAGTSEAGFAYLNFVRTLDSLQS
jgi:hypothetical protein